MSSRSIYINQTFETYEQFLELFNKDNTTHYDTWATTDSANINGQKKYKYHHFKCIYHQDPDKQASKTSSKGLRPVQSYI